MIWISFLDFVMVTVTTLNPSRYHTRSDPGRWRFLNWRWKTRLDHVFDLDLNLNNLMIWISSPDFVMVTVTINKSQAGR